MRSGPASGRGWRGVVGEGLLVVLVLVVFTRLHAAVGTDVAAADAHALTLQSLEEGLHLDVEVATNQWLTDHPALIGPAVLAYRLYYAAVVGVLVWLYLRRPEVYVPVRRVAVAMTGLALLVFWVLPMAPPRFALPGIVDIVATHDILPGQSTRDVSSGANFTAMPSLHVGWSSWCAYAIWSSVRSHHPRAALLAWLFPLAMVGVVLGTGNHYLLDVVGSAVLVLGSIGVAAAWGGLVDRGSTARVRAPR